MKILKYSIVCTLAVSMLESNAEGLGFPSPDVLEQNLIDDGTIQTSFPDNNRPPDWDTRPPEAGKIRLYAEVLLQEVKEEIGGILEDVPDGEEGKGSILYAKVTQWLQAADQILLNGTRTNLLALNPLHAEVFANANHRGPVDSSIMSMVAEIHNLSKALVYNMADFLSENPNPTVGQHDEMIVNFCIPTFIQENEWEDEPLPIDPAGVFVTNATNSAAKLKTKTLEEIKTFLGGSTDNSFFERYESAGDGMNLLKTKYAANKVAIQAKFAEVLAHVAQLEAQ